MSYIDSSTESPLARANVSPSEEEMFDPLDAHEDDEPEEHVPAERPPADSLKQRLLDQIEDINLARYLDQQTLDEIGMNCLREYEIDETSRKDWEDKARKAMRFTMQHTQPKQYPWPGAANTIYPLITQACLDFHARICGAIMPGKNIVKGIVWGSDRGTPVTLNGQPDGPPKMDPNPGPGGQQQPLWLIKPGEKRARADRIGEHMSWQLLDEMKEWAPQTDQLLLQIPAIGGAARKTFRDPAAGANRSLYVSLMNLVWNYHAPSFDSAPRHTEKVLIYPNEIIEYERTYDEDGDDAGGMFLPQEYGSAEGGTGESFNFDEDVGAGNASDDAAPHMFLEQHRLLDLDDDGYAEPYIVTIHKRSGKVVRIVARYTAEAVDASDDGETIYRIQPTAHYTLYPFLPSPDGGSYPLGFGHLLRTINEAINTSYNQLFDAGHLANAGGGFMADSINIPSGQALFQVGKFIRVATKGAPIRDAVLPLPFPGPNMALFQVLGGLVSAGKEIGGIGAILTGDAAIANAPPTTILALIEQGLKGYTAIAQRIFRAEKQELAKLYDLNRLYLTDNARYRVGDEWREVTPEDYRLGGGVEPVTDPTMATDMQKLARAQILRDYNGDPLINQQEIRRRLFEAANMDRIDELFVPPDPQAAAMQQQAMQIKMAQEQAEIGRTRAAELKDQTQAFLNMALARKNANSQEEAWIESQLDFLRLHIEALNTTVKAAAVDHKFHDTNVKASQAQAALLASGGGDTTTPSPALVQPTPGPTGAFPTPPSAPIAPDVVNPGSMGTGNPAIPGPAAPALAPAASIPGL